MTKISGIAYLIIGAAISIIAQIVNSTSQNQAMTLFFYIGLVFVLVGIIKIILKYAKNTGQKPVDHHHQPVHPLHHTVQHHAQHPHHQTHHKTQQSPATHHVSHHAQHSYPQHSQQHQMFPQHLTCRNCQAKNSLQSNFCHRCGARLR